MGDLLYIDQHIFKESNARRKNVALLWIDKNKAYDMVSQTWIIDYKNMCKISEKRESGKIT